MSSDGLFSQRSHKRSIALSMQTGGGHGNTAIKDPLKKMPQNTEKHINTCAHAHKLATRAFREKKPHIVHTNTQALTLVMD